MAKEFVVANTIEEALAAKHPGAVFLAGGTEINRLDSSVEADTLISIRGIKDLAAISEQGNDICIGALCTFQQVVESDIVPDWMKKACLFMASRTKRNMATIGGNIAVRRTDSYLAATLLAVQAKVKLAQGEAVDFLDYIGGSGCGDGQGSCPYGDALIESVIIPKDMAFVESKRTANTAQSHAALTVAFAAKEKLDDVSMAAAVKNGGIYYLQDLMTAIREDHDVSEEKLIDMVLTCKGASFPTDMFGSEKYKRYILGVTVAGLLADAKKGGLS